MPKNVGTSVMDSTPQPGCAGSQERASARIATPWLTAIAGLRRRPTRSRRRVRHSDRASPIPAPLATETIRYLLTVAGAPGMTRDALVLATGMTIKQVGVATRRMRTELHAIGVGFGARRTVRWSLVRAATD